MKWYYKWQFRRYLKKSQLCQLGNDDELFSKCVWKMKYYGEKLNGVNT